MKWIVETGPEVFESVKAGNVRIVDGCLWFYNVNRTFVESMVVCYAKGTWLSVLPDEDEEI